MAKTKAKSTAKPKNNKQEVDGLDMSFEEAMKQLAQQPDKVKANKKDK